MSGLKQKHKAAEIQSLLDTYFPEVAVPLEYSDAYTLLIAVVLSAQCTDERVNKVTPVLFKLANTPQQMTKLNIHQIEKIIKPCGLSARKAKAIHELSKILIQKHESKVPQDWDALEALPGVGHKTASVVMSQAFQLPAFPVDTHIHRLAQRWGLSQGKNVITTERDLKKLFPESSWNKLHIQMILFGRTYCKARGHKDENCPVCSKFGIKQKIKTGNPERGVK